MLYLAKVVLKALKIAAKFVKVLIKLGFIPIDMDSIIDELIAQLEASELAEDESESV